VIEIGTEGAQYAPEPPQRHPEIVERLRIVAAVEPSNGRRRLFQ
jgi:hypothetical protein